MKSPAHPEHEPYLTRLRALPFVRRAEIRRDTAGRGQEEGRTGTSLVLKTPGGRREHLVLHVRTHLTQAVADGILARMEASTQKGWILFAPYVGRGMARHLRELDVDYVDRAGNCRLHAGRDHIAVIEGRKPRPTPPRGRGMGAAGTQVLFAILAKPGLLDEPLRTLAQGAGANKTTVAHTIARLQEEGILGAGSRGRVLLEPRVLLDMWLAGYTSILRPHLRLGRYQTQSLEPSALEARIERALGDEFPWAWGGGAGGYRLTSGYRGDLTVLHIAGPPADLPRRLGALRAKDGPLVILKTRGDIAFEGVVRGTVHPLLIYTELLTAGSPQARSAAQEILEGYLEWLT
jgi:hypothetical protein